jgi:hypothetical protein
MSGDAPIGPGFLADTVGAMRGRPALPREAYPSPKGAVGMITERGSALAWSPSGSGIW